MSWLRKLTIASINANLRRKEDRLVTNGLRRDAIRRVIGLNLWNSTPPSSKAGDPVTLRRKGSLRNDCVSTATSLAIWPETADNQRKGTAGRGLASN